MPDPGPLTGSSEQSTITELLSQITNLQTRNPEVKSISKVPKFYKQDPACWFLIVEAALARARITSEKSKAQELIAQLDPDIVAHVKDIINLQPDNLYSQIKDRLISTYSISNEAKLRQLLKGEVVNEGKPSLLLNRLRSLNDNACSDDVLKSIFLEQLPSSIRAILAMSQVADLSALATLADKVCEASSPTTFQTFAVAPHSATTSNVVNPSSASVSQSATDPIVAIVAQQTKLLEELSNRIAQLERQRGRPTVRSNSRGNFGPRNRSKSNNRGGPCFYHDRYRKKAHKCQAPCSWKPAENSTSEN
ncbi:uncharacterized protein LOC117182577 [Belonocnema kinseyi]|uniref:uncharacterized protein LOC117182577 n=1 Tax=Belonocnema kinseyi TaxID=2817044 RepID=UPI00143DA30F|nr:uncharacterized protein LOC117182577 [Belonocnema kinseyi]